MGAAWKRRCEIFCATPSSRKQLPLPAGWVPQLPRILRKSVSRKTFRNSAGLRSNHPPSKNDHSRYQRAIRDHAARAGEIGGRMVRQAVTRVDLDDFYNPSGTSFWIGDSASWTQAFAANGGVR